jgi:hypothetical protein
MSTSWRLSVILSALGIPIRGTTTEEKRACVRDLIAMWTPSERATYANVVTMVRSLGDAARRRPVSKEL